jgi:hypothetical protein
MPQKRGPIGVRAESPSVTRKRAFLSHAAFSIDFLIRFEVANAQSNRNIAEAARERGKDVKSLWYRRDGVYRNPGKNAQQIGLLGSLFKNELVT